MVPLRMRRGTRSELDDEHCVVEGAYQLVDEHPYRHVLDVGTPIPAHSERSRCEEVMVLKPADIWNSRVGLTDKSP
jgi:hypothetical protein